jgi:hypothetical protein
LNFVREPVSCTLGAADKSAELGAADQGVEPSATTAATSCHEGSAATHLGAETCYLSAANHGAELRVHFPNSFWQGSNCELLSQKGPKSKKKSAGRPRAPEIDENRNVKRCRNWIRACAGETGVKTETKMSVGEGPSGGGVNPMPETRVLDWILSDSDEGPSSNN